MRNYLIRNDAPFSLYFKSDSFVIIQSNYHSFKEVQFTNHPNDKILSLSHGCTVAVFKVKPKKQQVTNMDIANEIIYSFFKNEAA